VSGLELVDLIRYLPHVEQVDEEEDWLGQQVEDAVEEHFTVGRDDVASVSQTPCDGVEKPQSSENERRDGVRLVGFVTESLSVGTSWEDEGPEDVEHGHAGTLDIRSQHKDCRCGFIGTKRTVK